MTVTRPVTPVTPVAAAERQRGCVQEQLGFSARRNGSGAAIRSLAGARQLLRRHDDDDVDEGYVLISKMRAIHE